MSVEMKMSPKTLKLAEDYAARKIKRIKITKAVTSYVVDGEALRKARLAAGFGLVEFAKLVGVSGAFICDIEHNRRSGSAETIERMERVLAKGKVRS